MGAKIGIGIGIGNGVSVSVVSGGLLITHVKFFQLFFFFDSFIGQLVCSTWYCALFAMSASHCQFICLICRVCDMQTFIHILCKYICLCIYIDIYIHMYI